MAECCLCNTNHPSDEILNHLRLMHPDHYGEGVERWPDGSTIVLDATLEPDDFTQ